MGDLERKVHDWLFKASPEEGFEMDERARRIYRRQVRRSLMRGVKVALPVTRGLLSAEELDGLLVRWMDASPPTTRLYWQLPLEFAAWLSEQPDLPHAALAELVHWETIEVDVLNAPDRPDEELARTFTDDDTVVLDPSARLCIYNHPVHRIDRKSPAWPDPAPMPLFLVIFRLGERFGWNGLSPQAAQLLAQLAGGASFGQGWAFLESLYGEVDRGPIVDRLLHLVERGAITGFRAP